MHFHTQDRPATINDILRLGERLERGQQEMARYIVEGLSQNFPQPWSNTANDHDTGVEGDIKDEGGFNGRPTGRGRRTKARKPWENLLSVCASSPPNPLSIFSPVL
jgi:hypothetical protein